MSKIPAVYDGLVAKLSELFPDKTRIPYPYSLGVNIDNFLFDGYGLLIGGGSYEPLEFNSFTVAYDVSVVLTREVLRTNSDTESIDDITKKLLDDVTKVQSLLYSPDRMGIDELLNVEISGVSGIDEVIAGKSRLLSMTASFNMSVLENI